MVKPVHQHSHKAPKEILELLDKELQRLHALADKASSEKASQWARSQIETLHLAISNLINPAHNNALSLTNHGFSNGDGDSDTDVDTPEN